MEYVLHHRVRYRECDPMGVVYHAHYVDHFEAARTEALRAHGLPYRELEEAGIIMPVVDLRVRYHRPARYDDLLAVTVRFPELPTVRIRAEYAVYRLEPEPEDASLVTGTVVLCFVDARRNRPVRAPQALLDVFERAQQEVG
ncbi:MAG: thioesterase family protein [Rhodothermales bacterium]|nr:thioesterase family protein [Rhodothermales bacterium]